MIYEYDKNIFKQYYSNVWLTENIDSFEGKKYYE